MPSKAVGKVGSIAFHASPLANPKWHTHGRLPKLRVESMNCQGVQEDRWRVGWKVDRVSIQGYLRAMTSKPSEARARSVPQPAVAHYENSL